MMKRSILCFAAAGATVLSAACGTEHADERNYGDLEITTSAPTAGAPFTTTDGWTVQLARFLVHVSAVSVAGDDEVLTASSERILLDQVAPGTKSLLSASVRKARPWENVSLQVGPVGEADVTLVEPAAEADRDAMRAGGHSIVLEGTATRAEVSKTFRWGLATETQFVRCEGEVDGAIVRGLVVPVGGADTANVVMRADVFLTDDGGVLRFDPVAAADVDGNGEVTREELEGAGLLERVEARSTGLVGSFRERGRCFAERVPGADGSR